MVELKPSRTPEGDELKNQTDGNTEQASKTKKYGCKNHQNKPSPEPEAETNFKGRCTDLEGCIFDLGRRASDKFPQTMKELDQYLGATYIYICRTAILTETPATFPDPEMPTMIWALSAQK